MIGSFAQRAEDTRSLRGRLKESFGAFIMMSAGSAGRRSQSMRGDTDCARTASCARSAGINTTGTGWLGYQEREVRMFTVRRTKSGSFAIDTDGDIYQIEDQAGTTTFIEPISYFDLAELGRMIDRELIKYETKELDRIIKEEEERIDAESN